MPVVNGSPDVVEHAPDVGRGPVLRLVDVVAVHSQAHPRFGNRAGRPRIIDIEVEDSDQVAVVIPLHDQLRVHDESDGAAFLRERGRDRIDEERHVVGDDRRHRGKTLPVAPDAHLRLPGEPPAPELSHRGDLVDERWGIHCPDVITRDISVETGEEEPELVVDVAVEGRDHVLRYVRHMATLVIKLEGAGMATTLDFSQTYEMDATAVRAMLIDGDYIVFRAEQTGATSVTFEVSEGSDGATIVVVERVLPANVPSFAKSFIGETLTVTERQEWATADPDGTGSAVASASFSAPLVFTGAMSITSDGTTTTVRTFGEYKASIPFMGGKIEEMAKEQTQRYLAKEEQLARAWLLGERQASAG